MPMTKIYFEPVGKMRKASLAQKKQFYRSAKFTLRCVEKHSPVAGTPET